MRLTKQRLQEESLDLDPSTAKVLDGENRSLVSCRNDSQLDVSNTDVSNVRTRHKPKPGDNQVTEGNLPQPMPHITRATVKVNLLKDDVLIEIDAVETVSEFVVRDREKER